MQKILEHIEADGEVDIKNIAALLEVSEITVRRDLNQLAADGLLYRTHGGAVKVNPLQKPHAFVNKSAQNAEVKDAICRLASTQINDGDIIFMDCGSTVFRLCRFIKNKKIKVITNSLPVVYELQDSMASVNIIGGELDKERQAVHGATAIEHINKYRANKAFLGVDGISAAGLFANSENEASITKAFLANCAYNYILCDSSKIGRETYLNFAPLTVLNAIITNADNSKTNAFAKHGLVVMQTQD